MFIREMSEVGILGGLQLDGLDPAARHCQGKSAELHRGGSMGRISPSAELSFTASGASWGSVNAGFRRCNLKATRKSPSL